MAGLGFSFTLKGLEKVEKALSKATIETPLGQAVKKITLFLDRETKMATPVDTGRLRSSITSKVESTPLGVWGRVGTNVNYATFVEYGTRKMEARHIEGSAVRVKGTGPFTHAMSKLQERIGEFVKDLGQAIKVKWG